MATYDWTALRTEYITGEFKSVRAFAKKKRIPYDSIKTKSKGWTEEKHRKDTAKTPQIIARVTEEQIEKEISRATAELNASDNIMQKLTVSVTQFCTVYRFPDERLQIV